MIAMATHGLPEQEYDYVRRLGLQHPISKIVEMTGLKDRHVHKILSRAEDNPSGRPKSLSPECCKNLIKLQQTGQLPLGPPVLTSTPQDVKNWAHRCRDSLSAGFSAP